MKVVSFGSCFAFYTAQYYCKAFGGEVLSCVYHHRSDQFVNCYVDKIVPPLSSEIIKNRLHVKSDNKGVPDPVASLMLRNQQEPLVGKHNVPTNRPFFDVMRDETVDLVIIDNHMDVHCKLFYPNIPEVDPRSSIFFVGGKVDFEPGTFVMGDHISLKASAENFERIIETFHEWQPNACLVFLQFPYCTYQNPKIEERSIAFQEMFSSSIAHIVDPFFIPDKFRTDSPGHFVGQLHFVYAGMIHAFVCEERRKKEERNRIKVLSKRESAVSE